MLSENPRYKGTFSQLKGKEVMAVIIHGNPADVEVEESEGSFHPNIVRTL